MSVSVFVLALFCYFMKQTQHMPRDANSYKIDNFTVIKI